MTDHTEISEGDGILTLTLTRDEKRNAISPEITAALWEAAREVAGRDDLRALLITARGRYFSAGYDLASAPTPDSLTTGSAFRTFYRKHHLLYDEMEALEKPVILAAQGPCLGAGLEMACSCDFRLAAESAYFQLPEVALGMVPGSGGVSRLTRLVGPHWAKWVAMANQKVDARQALAIGLVHQVLPDEGFHEAAHEFARELVTLPGETLGAVKLAVAMASEVDLATARNVERLTNSYLFLGESFTEGTRRLKP